MPQYVDRSLWQTRSRSIELKDAYVDWIVEKIQTGSEATLLTFMFKNLKRTEANVRQQMTNEITRVHSRIVSQTYRHPRKKPIEELPFWMVCFDWPVAKSAAAKIPDIEANGGQHAHAIAITPDLTRMKVSLSEHFAAQQARYSGRGHKILRIDATPLDRTPRDATEYVMKQLKRGRQTAADVVILPRSQSELPTYSRAERREHAIACR